MKPKPKKADQAGHWGTPQSCVHLSPSNQLSLADFNIHIRDCDTPLRLYNVTMQWLEEEWADQVDFVICTRRFYLLSG